MVDKWQMIDGIPSDIILSIAQTADGYLWIGTSKGLVRFDGKTFKIIQFAVKEAIYKRQIWRLFVDRSGILWIGSITGLTRYNPGGRRFKVFTEMDGITAQGVRHIIDDSKGNIWLSFEAGYVNRYSDGKFTVFDDSDGLLGKKINTMIEDRQGNLLFAAREEGIFMYREGKFLKYHLPELEHAIILTICEDRDGDLWIGTTTGLFKVNPTDGNKTVKYTVDDGLSNGLITRILEDSEKNIWVGTGRGLNLIKKNRDGSISVEILLEDLEIFCLFEDKEKSVWVGSGNSGIRRLKGAKFMPYVPFEAFPGHSPLSLFEDRQGDTWIGTSGGTLFHFRGGQLVRRKVIPGLTGTDIAAITEDSSGYLWLGTTGKGVFQKKNNSFVPFTTEKGLADNLVTSIYRDSRGNLWFGTFDGVSVLRSADGTFRSLKFSGGLAGSRVHNVYETAAGDIWIAADRGITILKGDDLNKSPWHSKTLLAGISVTCIYEDPSAPRPGETVYWLATDGAGLKRLTLPGDEITSYTTAQGMTTNSIYQFLEDRLGNFWCMSNNGILRVAKTELNRIAAGRLQRLNCISYGESDGLRSLEFANVLSRNSILAAENGEFRFITNKGISVVNPAEIVINKIPPAVVIEAVYWNGQPVPLPLHMEPLVFKGSAELRFHFTAPTFLSSKKIGFEYRLEGVDRQWKFLPPGQQRIARCERLNPGTYTFRVRACNADGVWNKTGAAIILTIKPYFFQTLLFKIALLFGLMTLSAAAFYLYKKRGSVEKKAKHKTAPLNLGFAEECITKLNYLMEIERLYCDADLSLHSLAEKISIAPYQLSQLLNENMKRSFADYVNGYRIEEAKKILRSSRGEHRKVYAIAIDVGFNTMAAFYKAFKKNTGMTPTEYKKMIKHKK
jgi:ligand-binding sensor domain-containing protein/AraC-like DNA-binding protein